MNSSPTRPRFQAKTRKHPVWLGDTKDGWHFSCTPNALLDDEQVGHLEIAVYMGIARHANIETGKSFPSSETLAKYARCSRASVFKAVRRLEELGYLHIDSGGGRRSNTYCLVSKRAENQDLETDPTPEIENTGFDQEPRDLDTGTITIQPDLISPYIPLEGDSLKVDEPAKKKRLKPYEKRPDEAAQVECPGCRSKPGFKCGGKRGPRSHFHDSRHDVASDWATEHLVVSKTSEYCFTCNGDGRIINELNIVQPCWSCRP